MLVEGCLMSIVFAVWGFK